MPNEIYHRSNWGESKAEDFGDVYYDHAATNKLYNHSDYYENSDGTDATLKDLNNKASIVLTPTAYSDGSLNTVIPPYAPSYIDNVPFVTSEWTNLQEGWSIDETNNKLVAAATWTGINKRAEYEISEILIGKTIRISFDAVVTAGEFNVIRPYSISSISTSGSYTFTDIATTATIFRFLNKSTDFAGEITNIKVEVIEEADFDFSRGSSATRVNEQGLVEDVQILSGELVQNGNFEQIGSELVTNGNFDTDSDWTKGGVWTIENGSANGDATFGNLAQLGFPFVGGKFYKVTYEVKNYVNGNVKFQFTGGTSVNGATRNANGVYTEYVKAETGNVTFRFRGTNFTGSIDNVSVKEVGQNWTFYNADSNTNTRFEDNAAVLDATANQFTRFISSSSPMTIGNLYRISYEVIETDNTTISIQYPLTYISSSLGVHTVDIIATNTNIGFAKSTVGVVKIDNVSIKEVTNDTDLPRIDFTDGTGSLLLEPQRTNLVNYSEDFTQWTAGSNTSLTFVSDVVAPDGSLGVYRLTLPAQSSTYLAANVFASQNPLALSIYAKSVNTNNDFNFYDGNNPSSTKTATDEWQRFNYIGNGDEFVIVNFGDTFETDIYIWGAQAEAGSYATSYIPTSGSTVTRSADVANNSGNADLFNDSEGVLYAEIAALANDGTFRSISISSDAGYNNSIMIRYVSTSNQINVITRIGSATNNTSVDVNDITEFNKIAFKYKSENCVLFINGVQVATSSQAFNSSGINNLSFDRGGGAAEFYGKTKAVAVFKEALTDEQLQKLTS